MLGEVLAKCAFDELLSLFKRAPQFPLRFLPLQRTLKYRPLPTLDLRKRVDADEIGQVEQFGAGPRPLILAVQVIDEFLRRQRNLLRIDRVARLPHHFIALVGPLVGLLDHPLLVFLHPLVIELA